MPDAAPPTPAPTPPPVDFPDFLFDNYLTTVDQPRQEYNAISPNWVIPDIDTEYTNISAYPRYTFNWNNLANSVSETKKIIKKEIKKEKPRIFSADKEDLNEGDVVYILYYSYLDILASEDFRKNRKWNLFSERSHSPGLLRKSKITSIKESDIYLDTGDWYHASNLYKNLKVVKQTYLENNKRVFEKCFKILAERINYLKLLHHTVSSPNVFDYLKDVNRDTHQIWFFSTQSNNFVCDELYITKPFVVEKHRCKRVLPATPEYSQIYNFNNIDLADGSRWNPPQSQEWITDIFRSYTWLMNRNYMMCLFHPETDVHVCYKKYIFNLLHETMFMMEELQKMKYEMKR